jgi:hypothetical protein
MRAPGDGRAAALPVRARGDLHAGRSETGTGARLTRWTVRCCDDDTRAGDDDGGVPPTPRKPSGGHDGAARDGD